METHLLFNNTDTVIDRTFYGEGLPDDQANNLRGQVYQHYDGSGLQMVPQYDFKGNPVLTQQQLLEDGTLTDVDWNSSPALSSEVFESTATLDALNRPMTTTDPGGNVQAFTYDRGGLLQTVTLNGNSYVNNISYDAKAQRQSITYGNGTKTNYTYDPDTFRVRNVQTIRQGDGVLMQDLGYYYDPVGNVTEITDAAQQTLFFNNSIVSPTQSFTYDAIYRLIQGNGRELVGTATVGSDTYSYSYDARGNMATMPQLQNMGWNALNELYTITQGSTWSNYQYSGGQRVRKYVNKGSIVEERIYLGNYEIYRKFDGTGSLTLERTTVHVSDDTGRIAMLEVRTQGTDDNPASLNRFVYSNHLQSATLELNENAQIISYEEYHPYGTTAYQANNASINAVAKRYRYTGKERDEESGLYYHGARYYIPWLCRWTGKVMYQN